jgi:lysine 2,3-aminomutase
MAEDLTLTEAAPWPRALRNAARTNAQLTQGLSDQQSFDLDSHEFDAVAENFSVQIPQQLLLRLEQSPALRKQFLPNKQELVFHPEELADPIGDEPHSPVSGLTHRYPDRVLLKLTHHCAVYCRFCFRREKVSKEPMLGDAAFEAALKYIAADKRIWEVILTGGDPLILTDTALSKALRAIASIPHVKCIRFHTRIPTALPERITPDLVELLCDLRDGDGNRDANGDAAGRQSQRTGCQPWMVVHMNSSDEFTQETDAALRRLARAGIPVLCQSVLLRGVNDTPGQLEALLRGLVARGIKPYYLHTLDLARGTDHFRVELGAALELYDGLRSRLSGTCIPQFILDIPGGLGKISISCENLRRVDSKTWQARSPITGSWVAISYPAGSR